MEQKNINRRKFLIRSLQSAAGIGVIAGCDKRSIIGPDVRSPSAPNGLSQKLSFIADKTAYSIDLSWNAHDLTDNTGAKSETSVTYNLYRKTDLETVFDTNPIASNLQSTTYSDNSPEVQSAFLRLADNPNIVFQYKISAVDASGNESDFSVVLSVPIKPFVDVFVVTNAQVYAKNPDGKMAFQPEVAKSMLNSAVMEMTNQNAIPAAWESLFPSLTVDTLIGIKINTLAGLGGVNTQPVVVDAIVFGLTQMLGGTFPAYNIIVFDDRNPSDQMKAAGYILRNVQGSYRIASTSFNTTLDSSVPVATKQNDSDLWGTTLNVAGVSQQFSKIIDTVDYLINVPVLKDHIQAGITFSMKNLYGIVNYPQGMHDSMCCPFIPALYNTLLNGIKIKDKIRLIVGDALLACFTGGPTGAPSKYLNTIIVGTDPVAMDKWALDTINANRNAKAQIAFGPDKDARHVFIASLPPYSLGSTNYKVREVL